MSILKRLFSIEKREYHKIITILGVKIKIRNDNLVKNLELDEYYKKITRIIPRPSLDHVLFHLVDHCNLNCKNCDVCSPIAEERFVSLESFEKDIKRLAELTKGNVSLIILTGGEALLNPDIIEMFSIARINFPNTILRLHSNGILLMNRDENFWQAIENNKITIVCTKYPINVDYEYIKQQAEKYNVDFLFYNDEKVLKTSYHIPFDINGSQEPRENFINCFHANDCIGIHDGKLYTCTPAANAHHFKKFFNVDMKLDENDYIDIHQASSIQEILDFLAKPIPFCRYCNVKGRSYNHQWGISKKQIEEWS